MYALLWSLLYDSSMSEHGMVIWFHYSDWLAHTDLFIYIYLFTFLGILSALLGWPWPCAQIEATTEILDIFIRQQWNNLLVGKYTVLSQ